MGQLRSFWGRFGPVPGHIFRCWSNVSRMRAKVGAAGSSNPTSTEEFGWCRPHLGQIRAMAPRLGTRVEQGSVLPGTHSPTRPLMHPTARPRPQPPQATYHLTRPSGMGQLSALPDPWRCRPNPAPARLLPNLARAPPNLVDLGTQLVELGPDLAEVGPDLVDIGTTMQARSTNVVKCWPDVVKFGRRCSTVPGQICPNSGRIRPSSPKHLPELDQLRPNSRIPDDSGRDRDKCGRSRPDLVVSWPELPIKVV